MAKKTKLTGKQKLMIEALTRTLGNITRSCETAKIDRSTHYDWLEKNPEYKRLVEELPERQVDFYETALHKLIESGNPTSVIFALKTKGKHRGWVEQQEIKIGRLTHEDVMSQLKEAMGEDE